jgi:excisionase family DNA binding protein
VKSLDKTEKTQNIQTIDDTQESTSSLKSEYGEWLTTKQAALFLGISPGVLRNKVSFGEVPAYKFGRLNRYRRNDLEGLLRKKE